MSKIVAINRKVYIMTESSVIDIVVREANANDFEFVASLMVRALASFYDGDHRAYA